MSEARDELFSKLKEIIQDRLDVELDVITEGASFVDDLGADSLAVVELVLALEEQFGLTISDEETDKLRTVGDVLAYIEANQQVPVREAS